MDMDAITPEMLEKAKQAATAEELQELAKTNGVVLTSEQAGAAFAKLHTSGELSDDELENVSGGKSSSCQDRGEVTSKSSQGRGEVTMY